VLGPRVYIPARYLAETQLLGFGARAEYEAVATLPPASTPTASCAPARSSSSASGCGRAPCPTPSAGLTQAVDRLSDFLSVVGLIALLLGGVGVASGVGAFVARKLDTVAVLRCLGASSRQVLVVYVTQAAAMGLAGAGAGVLLGVACQWILPRVLGDFLPVDVVVRPEPVAIGSGLLVGLWVALVFALRPLLGLRRVSPLQAIRRDVDPAAARGRGFDWATRLVDVAVGASVLGLAINRTGRLREGAGITVAIFAALFVLWLSATGVTWLARRLVRAGWPYVIRQGLANLYRPGSQTRAVTLALGFGAFLVSTVYLARGNLLADLDCAHRRGARQRALLRRAGGPGRAARLDGARARLHGARRPHPHRDDARGRGERPHHRAAPRRHDAQAGPWPLRREYRSTYRTAVGDAERVVAGRFFAGEGAVGAETEVSLETGVARELGVGLGDRITWDVSGRRVPTRVTSLRQVEWARFEPNFFVVFQPGALRTAPKQFVLLARVPGEENVARLQRDVVTRYPNVASVDLSLVQRTVGTIVERVSLAVRFLGAFCLAIGIPVLFSAVAATRRDRLRDAVLLKTLGATRAQVRRILLAEYAALGVLGALAGMVLSFGGAWALAHYVFRQPFRPDWVAALGVAALLTLVTVAIGLLTGRDAYRETPMAADPRRGSGAAPVTAKGRPPCGGRPFAVTGAVTGAAGGRRRWAPPAGAAGQRLSAAVSCGRLAAVVDVTVRSPRAPTV
jgi:putative ABC transport system permease protein